MPAKPPKNDSPIHTSNIFQHRHIGPRAEDVDAMLEFLGFDDLDALEASVVPANIRSPEPLRLDPPRSEQDILTELYELSAMNQVFRSFIGMGYHNSILPPVIQRSVLENPGWYTAYTPYQAEISQGRLEALLNFQTMVADLTALATANASLLDEGTAAAEAMTLCLRVQRRNGPEQVFFVSNLCHPQTLAVVRARAEAVGIEIVVGDHDTFEFNDTVFGALIQYPASDGRVLDYERFCERAHASGALVVAATDLLALTLLRPPGDFGVDVAVGNTQRFGVPLGFGGPHAAFIACRPEYVRQLPGRIVGVSKDAEGRPAVRMALQTREQHIRRDKATSNICTAQVLLAVIASMYGVYHGPEGLRRIARRVHAYTKFLARVLREHGFELSEGPFFDTLRVIPGAHGQQQILERAEKRRINLRLFENRDLGVSLDETVGVGDLRDLCEAFSGRPLKQTDAEIEDRVNRLGWEFDEPHRRETSFMEHPVFHSYHSETEFLRYAHRLESRDLSLTNSMIPLGSCTMKLNAAAEMYPISYAGFADLHPFAPASQVRGYQTLFDRLERWLAEITGFDQVTLMPNSGAQGEYTGLLVIRAYHASRGQEQRDVCLIPESAHGTNPASAVMSGLKVVVVACDDEGNIDLADLNAKCAKHSDALAALMVTYPSTHGVFEASIREICDTVHAHGGQVYLDGANMNAMVGICKPGEFGADVCHLNLHKTFCIPHGGGGPGVGPVAVAKHLAPFIPRHPLAMVGGEQGIGPVASAPFGSAGILPISYAYIAMMGADGMQRASRIAILNANYVARRLDSSFPLLFRGADGLVAHECILDVRPFQKTAGITVEDVAKRLMDYGFHAPTMSWPVAGTLMVEPTESESKAELDRFCDAMISIREEIREIESGVADRDNNLLKNAPHTASMLVAETWDRPYTRERAVFPVKWVREHKFWPAVARIDNAYGDRNVVCSCPPVDAYAEV